MTLRHLVAIFLCALTATPSLAQDKPDAGNGKVSVDIYAIPSPEIVAEVARASADLGRMGMTSFHARGQAVHATLYLTQYSASALPRLKRAVASLARAHRPFSLISMTMFATASAASGRPSFRAASAIAVRLFCS